jgi:hypothetical protein
MAESRGLIGPIRGFSNNSQLHLEESGESYSASGGLVRREKVLVLDSENHVIFGCARAQSDLVDNKGVDAARAAGCLSSEGNVDSDRRSVPDERRDEITFMARLRLGKDLEILVESIEKDQDAWQSPGGWCFGVLMIDRSPGLFREQTATSEKLFVGPPH